MQLQECQAFTRYAERVEQVASLQQRPHEALLDGSTSYALTDQELDSQSPQRMSRRAVERNTPVYNTH